MSAAIENAIRAIGRGEVVIVTDDDDRENEGDLIMAAEAVTPEQLAFVLRHTSGVVCAALPGARLDDLDLPLMVGDNREAQGTAFTVTVDLAERHHAPGISAADRAMTIRALADPHAGAGDFVRPGHVFPLRAATGGVLERRRPHRGGRRSGPPCRPAAGRHPLRGRHARRRAMARRPELEPLARAHDLPLVSIADLIRHRRRTERSSQGGVRRRVPTRHGTFTLPRRSESLTRRHRPPRVRAWRVSRATSRCSCACTASA